MASLHNRISRRELKEKLIQDPTPRTTISFYQYFQIDSPQLFRDQFYQALYAIGVLGRIYVAREGINAQMSVPEENWEIFKYNLHADPKFSGIPFKIAVEDDGKSFYKLTIKI